MSSTITSCPSCARCSGRRWTAKSSPRRRSPSLSLAAQLEGRSGQSKGLSDAVGRSATVLLESLVEHTEEGLLLGGPADPLTGIPPTSAVRCGPSWKH